MSEDTRGPTAAWHPCWYDVIGVRERRLTAGRPHTAHVGGRVALLMVDLFAQAFTSAESLLSCEPWASDAIPTLQRLLDAARAAGVPVVHSTGEDRSEARPGSATLMSEARYPSDRALSEKYRIIDELQPEPQEHVVYKSGASAFFGTSLASILRRLDVTQLVVCGETTSGCVRATVIDAYSHGYDVVLPQEAIFDRSSISHKVNLFDMHVKYATVVPVDQVAHSWEKISAR